MLNKSISCGSQELIQAYQEVDLIEGAKLSKFNAQNSQTLELGSEITFKWHRFLTDENADYPFPRIRIESGGKCTEAGDSKFELNAVLNLKVPEKLVSTLSTFKESAGYKKIAVKI